MTPQQQKLVRFGCVSASIQFGGLHLEMIFTGPCVQCSVFSRLSVYTTLARPMLIACANTPPTDRNYLLLLFTAEICRIFTCNVPARNIPWRRLIVYLNSVFFLLMHMQSKSKSISFEFGHLEIFFFIWLQFNNNEFSEKKTKFLGNLYSSQIWVSYFPGR